MTDSNLNNNSLLNNEEEENTNTINQNNQVVETDNQQTVNNFVMSDENQNIGFQNKNIFTKDIFKSDLSFIDFNTEFNLNNLFIIRLSLNVLIGVLSFLYLSKKFTKPRYFKRGSEICINFSLSFTSDLSSFVSCEKSFLPKLYSSLANSKVSLSFI